MVHITVECTTRLRMSRFIVRAIEPKVPIHYADLKWEYGEGWDPGDYTELKLSRIAAYLRIENRDPR